MQQDRYNHPWQREEREAKRRPRYATYDFETTPLPETPDDPQIEPRYLTAYDGERVFLSQPLRDIRGIADILESRFFTRSRRGLTYVAHNANKFDGPLIIQAIREYLPGYTVEPFESKQAGLRCFKVRDTKRKFVWMFQDSIAMTGLPITLKEFVKAFAPEYAKGDIGLQNGAQFDGTNPDHVAYAENDSIALWHALRGCEDQVFGYSRQYLRATIGALAIRYLTTKIPDGVCVWPEPSRVYDLLETHGGRRGGYVFARPGRYDSVTQGDINQAFPGNMRAARFPHGRCVPMRGAVRYDPDRVGIYVCKISRRTPPELPFITKDYETGNAVDSYGVRPLRTVLVNCEINFLYAHLWDVEFEEGWVWEADFSFDEFVNENEAFRKSVGPKSPAGMMAKQIGVNAYGKTGAKLPAIKRYVNEPDDHGNYGYDDVLGLWVEVGTNERGGRSYSPFHRPIIAAIITAETRMQVLRDAMRDAEHVVKIDTDSVAFDYAATFDYDADRYGKWKYEYQGVEMIVIAKKVAVVRKPDGAIKWTAKGLKLDELTWAIGERWLYDGVPPEQTRRFTMAWTKAIGGERHRIGTRRGTQVENTAGYIARLDAGLDVRPSMKPSVREIAREMWRADFEEYERVARGLRVRPDYVWRDGRWRIADEWLDVPARYIVRSRPTAQPWESSYAYGNADDVASQVGFASSDDLREWMTQHPSPPRIGEYEAIARRRLGV